MKLGFSQLANRFVAFLYRNLGETVPQRGDETLISDRLSPTDKYVAENTRKQGVKIGRTVRAPEPQRPVLPEPILKLKQKPPLYWQPRTINKAKTGLVTRPPVSNDRVGSTDTSFVHAPEKGQAWVAPTTAETETAEWIPHEELKKTRRLELEALIDHNTLGAHREAIIRAQKDKIATCETA